MKYQREGELSYPACIKSGLLGIYKTFLPDLSYLAPDCFHPSQKLQALCKILVHCAPKNLYNFFVIFHNIVEKEAVSTGTPSTILFN